MYIFFQAGEAEGVYIFFYDGNEYFSKLLKL